MRVKLSVLKNRLWKVMSVNLAFNPSMNFYGEPKGFAGTAVNEEDIPL